MSSGDEQYPFEGLAHAEPVGPSVVGGGQHGDQWLLFEEASGEHFRVTVGTEVPHRDAVSEVLRAEHVGWQAQAGVVVRTAR